MILIFFFYSKSSSFLVINMILTFLLYRRDIKYYNKKCANKVVENFRTIGKQSQDKLIKIFPFFMSVLCYFQISKKRLFECKLTGLALHQILYGYNINTRFRSKKKILTLDFFPICTEKCLLKMCMLLCLMLQYIIVLKYFCTNKSRLILFRIILQKFYIRKSYYKKQ